MTTTQHMTFKLKGITNPSQKTENTINSRRSPSLEHNTLVVSGRGLAPLGVGRRRGALLPLGRRPAIHAALGVVDPSDVGAHATAEPERAPLEEAATVATPPPLGAQPVNQGLQRVALHLEPGDVVAEAAHLLVLREDLALGGAAAGELQRRVGAGAALAAEGGAQLGEAVELVVLREEHLHHGAHRHALVLHGVRRGLRRELARVDQPRQRLALLLRGDWVRLSEDGAMPSNGSVDIRTFLSTSTSQHFILDSF